MAYVVSSMEREYINILIKNADVSESLKQFLYSLFELKNGLIRKEAGVLRGNNKLVCDKINNIIRDLTLPVEEWKKKMKFYDDLAVFSSFLHTSGASAEKQFKLIIEIIKRNMEVGLLDNFCVNGELLLAHNFKTLSKEEVKKLLKYGSDFETTELGLTVQQQEEVDEVLTELSKLDNDPVKRAHFIIKESYLDKQNDLLLVDIDNICKALDILGILPETVDNIRQYLLTRVRKNVIKDNIENYKNPKRVSVHFCGNGDLYKVDESIVSDKNSYKQMLEMVFDFRKNLPKCYLTIEEKIFSVTLMKKLKWNETDIRDFLMNLKKKKFASEDVSVPEVSKILLNEESALTEYAHVNFCEDELKELYEFLELSLSDVNDEEMKVFFEELASNFMERVFSNYEYIIVQAKALLENPQSFQKEMENARRRNRSLK